MNAKETAPEPVAIEDLVAQTKANLVLEHGEDDVLLTEMVTAALAYATSFQHLPEDHYQAGVMPASTRQGVVMLASHFYESRDGSTGGFYADNTNASAAVWVAVNRLLVLDRHWKV